MRSFTTRVSPPQVGTIRATSVGSTSAVVAGSVVPTNDAVSAITCQYVASPGNPAKGTAVAASPSRLASASVQRATTCALSGLSPNTTYLVRMQATDQAGTAASPNVLSVTTNGTGGGTTPSPGPGPGTGPGVAITSAQPIGDSRIQLQVRANQPGTLRLVGSYPLGTADVRASACRAQRTIARAGTVTMSCGLSGATRARLDARALRIMLRVTLTNAATQTATAVRIVRMGRMIMPPVTG